MSLFTDFVNTELPRRTVMTTATVAGYTGDPNDPAAPDMLKNSPKGTYYLRDSDLSMWFKRTSVSNTWVELTNTGGGANGVTEWWVDQATGNDNNAGTVGAPFATIGKAVSLCPLFMPTYYIIHIKAGTYAETINTLAWAGTSRLSTYIQLYGEDLTVVTPATGPSSGTFDGSSGRFATLSTATWTVNDLRGKFLRMTSGGALYLNNLFPIASNTATQIEVPFTASGLNGLSFEIVTPAVIITKAPGEFASLFNGPFTWCTPRRITFNSGAGTVIYNYGTFSATECFLTGGTTIISNNADKGSKGVGGVTRCFVNASNYGIWTSSGDSFNLNGSVIHGGSVLGVGTVDALAYQNILTLFSGTTNGCIIQGARDGIYHSTSVSNRSIYAIGLVVRNCTRYGIYLKSGAMNLDACEVSGNTTAGLYLFNNDSDHVCHRLNACAITGNTGDGISLHGTGEALSITGATNIASNGGYGINMAGTGAAVPPGNHTVAMSAAVTMSANTSGDINLGSAAISVATLRADSDKTYIDAVKLNRATSL